MKDIGTLGYVGIACAGIGIVVVFAAFFIGPGVIAVGMLFVIASLVISWVVVVRERAESDTQRRD